MEIEIVIHLWRVQIVLCILFGAIIGDIIAKKWSKKDV